MSLSAGSGGVSVRAGPSPSLDRGDRRLLRRLQRRYARAQREEEDASHIAGCALVCGSCGQLAWSVEGGAGHPLRTEPTTALRKAPACTHCEGTTWIDLQLEETALAMRQWETQAAGTRRRALMGTIGFGLIALSTGFGLIAFTTMEGMWALLMPIALLGIAAVLGTFRNYRILLDEKPVLPRRWDMALPPATEPALVATGAVSASESLRAPMSGRRCVAFEIGIRPDDDADGAPATWLLLEQHASALTVDGHAIDPEQTHLALVRKRLGTSAELDLDEGAHVFLRQRGFGRDSRTIVLFETVLEQGAHAELLQAPDGQMLLRG